MKELSFFTYGSWTHGQIHFNKIKDYVIQSEPATIRGIAYQLQCGYPLLLSPSHTGIERGDEEESIRGEFVQLHAPDIIISILDEFHGVSALVPEKSLFFREIVTIQTLAGENREAFVYRMNPTKLPKSAKRIQTANGELELENQPTLELQLTERQAAYIKRLSQSSGRDIVPIDIGLYRELIKLDLIVDKGRRLALSKLGLEVAKYLLE